MLYLCMITRIHADCIRSTPYMTVYPLCDLAMNKPVHKNRQAASLRPGDKLSGKQPFG